MECSKFEKYGFLYLANELSNKEKSMYDAHIKSCKICQDKINQYEMLQKATKEIYYTPSKKLDEKILDQIKVKRKISLKPLYSFIAAAVIAFFVFYIPQNQQKDNIKYAWNTSIFEDDNFINTSIYDEMEVLNDSTLVSFFDDNTEFIIENSEEAIDDLDTIDDLINSIDDMDII